MFIGNWLHQFKGDFKKIGRSLAIVLSQERTIDERYEAFETLHKIPIWRERGIGFLIDFFTEEQRPQVLRYELILSAKDVPGIHFDFGSFKEEKLYHSLMYIQNIIHDRSFDLRFYVDENAGLRSVEQIH